MHYSILALQTIRDKFSEVLKNVPYWFLRFSYNCLVSSYRCVSFMVGSFNNNGLIKFSVCLKRAFKDSTSLAVSNVDSYEHLNPSLSSKLLLLSNDTLLYSVQISPYKIH